MGKKKKERELSKGEKSPALFAQPDPVSEGPDIWPLVIKDMTDRNNLGKAKYGIPLRANNGRDALVDAYQEVLDLSVYLRQEIEERQSMRDAVVAAQKIAGVQGLKSHDIAGILTILAERVEEQRKHIQILSSTVIHYQTQSQFIAGYDEGVETAIKIFERIKGENLHPESVTQILNEASSWRENGQTS